MKHIQVFFGEIYNIEMLWLSRKQVKPNSEFVAGSGVLHLCVRIAMKQGPWEITLFFIVFSLAALKFFVHIDQYAIFALLEMKYT